MVVKLGMETSVKMLRSLRRCDSHDTLRVGHVSGLHVRVLHILHSIETQCVWGALIVGLLQCTQ